MKLLAACLQGDGARKFENGVGGFATPLINGSTSSEYRPPSTNSDLGNGSSSPKGSSAKISSTG